MNKFKTKPCSRCAGEKRLWQHGNVLNGVCFKCNGAGFVYLTKPAQLAYVMKRERVVIDGAFVGFGSWTMLAKGWVSADATPEGVKAQYLDKGHDPELLAVTIKTEGRKIPA